MIWEARPCLPASNLRNAELRCHATDQPTDGGDARRGSIPFTGGLSPPGSLPGLHPVVPGVICGDWVGEYRRATAVSAPGKSKSALANEADPTGAREWSDSQLSGQP